MSKRSTLLRELLRQRHWQTYTTFCRRYDEAARRTDAALVGHWPSRGQFARWLAGDLKGLPHPDHCRVLEAMFPGLSAHQLFDRPGASGAQGWDVRQESAVPGLPTALNGAASPVPNSPARPIAPAPSTPASPIAPTDPTTRPAHLDDQWIVAAASYAHRPSGPSGPTVIARTGHGHLMPEEIAMATEESARFVRGPRGGVDHDVLDQLSADVRQLAVDYLTRPPLALFRPLSALRHDVFELLDARQRPTILPPLYGVAGRLCALLAHASADLGHAYAAETHTRTAWLCADLADDDALRAYVRWVQANIAFWDGDYRRAAEIAKSGQRHATKGTNLLRLASQEARAWAACGDHREVERALAVATAAREHDLPDDQPGVFRFDPGKAAYYASEVRLALGGDDNARAAAKCALEALDIFDREPEDQRSPEFVAAARLDLANAQLALGDLDGAAEQLRVVLELPVQSRTQPIVGRVASAGATLTAPRFARSTLASELKDEIALFRAYPAQRDLPEVLD
jgi:hypothetical protein